ncbi:MAG TPA: hypothetical protein VFG76_12730 [Candidatus Polarisedimenticolia bacterium]|nr:hypothetical protein [Candidatus Polarisedimenticolia bacterium]
MSEQSSHFPWLVKSIESLAAECESLGIRTQTPGAGLLEEGWRDWPLHRLFDVATSLEGRVVHERPRARARFREGT